MPLISWHPGLSVTIDEIDQQHKKIIFMINELSDAMINKAGDEVMGEIIDEMIRYTDVHFKTEENYFERFGYKETAKHKEEHLLFVNKVVEFYNAFKKSESKVTLELLKFLSYWLQDHIKVSDKKYVELFKKNGVL